MVGDIFGKTWSSSTATSSSSPSLGLPKSNNPDLFGDLVGSALNQGKNNSSGSSNVPLKSVKNSYSMGSLNESLPNNDSGNGSVKNSHSAENFGNIGGGNGSSFNAFGDFSNIGQTGKSIGGNKPMNSMSGIGSNAKKDPFGSLMDFGVKKFSTASDSMSSQNVKVENFTKTSGTSSSFGANLNAMPAQNPQKNDDFAPFGDFTTAKKSDAKDSDPLDAFFGSSNNASNSSSNQQFGEMNDWEVEFGSGDHNEATTELEGLPPPPSGVTSSVAKSKGMDNYKQGQFADAIKWLSWAVVLMEKNGGKGESDEVLTCRASCYKEVGEYKKAVADCTKVLEHDSTNVPVLVQRALLYESTEKYRLGADDLRTVLKIDPTNRVAKSTIHRLNKMAA